MKSTPSLRFQSQLFSLLVIASLLIQLGVATPVLATSQTSLQSLPFTTCADVTEIPQAECEALVALYNSTNGAGWVNNTNWLATDTPCSWYGVSCGGGYVTSLNLDANLLTGSIPAELGNLTSLSSLSLSQNQVSGSIPVELGNLTQLQNLSLWENQLTGNIPVELGNLTQLEYVPLCGNQLTGTIPTELGNLTQLTGLCLSDNQLSGSIPTQLGNLTQMNSLRLSGNQLTGSIPTELGNLTQLTTIELNDNLLTGNIPAQLGDLTQLKELNFRGNQLSGSIPTQLGNLTQLTFLGLDLNQLSGSIPAELGNLTQLTFLALAGNQLTGSIPAELGNLTQLTWLGLCDNLLTGSIPKELGNLTKLEYFWLQGNQLTGSIPAELGNLTQLYTLQIADNQLSGEFPATITNLVNLTDLTFDCKLTSSDPAVIAFLNEKSPGWQANQCGPRFSVEPDEDIIEGNAWLLDSVVTIAFGDPSQPDYTTTTSVNPADQAHSEPWFKVDLIDVFDLQPGQTVTVFDAKTTKQITVTIRNITTIDIVTDTVTGTADSDIVSVVLWACDDNGCGARIKDVSSDGSWSVDFAQPGEQDWENVIVDIQPDTNGGIYQSDIDGDGTVYQEWYVLDNLPPDADAGPDQIVFAGDTIMLNATASSDPDGDALTYAWDLDNDGLYDDASGVTASISFSQVGEYVIGLQVTDAGGLSDTDTVVVTITPWTLKGFYQPVDMNGVYNLVKGGSTVPLKFEIFAGSTELTDIFDIKSLTYTETACDLNAVTDEIELTATGSTSLRYEGGQFIYNWKTPTTAGKCYRVTMMTMDGSSLVAYFKTK